MNVLTSFWDGIVRPLKRVVGIKAEVKKKRSFTTFSIQNNIIRTISERKRERK